MEFGGKIKQKNRKQAVEWLNSEVLLLMVEDLNIKKKSI